MTVMRAWDMDSGIEKDIHNGVLHVSFSKLHLLRLGSQDKSQFRYQIQLLILLYAPKLLALYPGHHNF